MMVKTRKKKDVPQDDKQKKILSFFNKQSDKGESSLFTKVKPGVATQSSCKLSAGKKTEVHYRVEESIGKCESKVNRKKIRNGEQTAGTENQVADDDIIWLDSVDEHKSGQTSHLKGVKTANTNIRQKIKETTTETDSRLSGCVEERETTENWKNSPQDKENEYSAFCSTLDTDAASISSVTPEKQNRKDNHCRLVNVDSSPEVICQTPGVDTVLSKAAVNRRKALATRSFLCSADTLTVQPGSRPGHLRNNLKCARGRRNLGTVSVTFNEQLLSDKDLDNSSFAPEHEIKHIESNDKEQDNNDLVHGVYSAKNKLLETPSAVPEDKTIMEREEGNSVLHRFEMQSVEKMPDTVEPAIEIDESIVDAKMSEVVRSNQQSNEQLNSTKFRICPAHVTDPDPCSAGVIPETQLISDSTSGIGHLDSPGQNVPCGLTQVSYCMDGDDCCQEDANVERRRMENPLSKTEIKFKNSTSDFTKESSKSKSRLIQALEGVDVRAQEKEDQMWVNEMLITMAMDNEGCTETYGSSSVVGGRGNIESNSVKRQLSSHLPSISSKRPKLNDNIKEVTDSDDFSYLGPVCEPAIQREKKAPSSLQIKEGNKIKKSLKERMHIFGFREKEKLSGDGGGGDVVTLENDPLFSEILGKLDSSSTNKSHSLSESCGDKAKISLGKTKAMNETEKGGRESLHKLSTYSKLTRHDAEIMEETFRLFGDGLSGEESEEDKALEKRNETSLEATSSKNNVKGAEASQDVIVIDSERLEEVRKTETENGEWIIIDDNSEEIESILTSRKKCEDEITTSIAVVSKHSPSKTITIVPVTCVKAESFPTCVVSEDLNPCLMEGAESKLGNCASPQAGILPLSDLGGRTTDLGSISTELSDSLEDLLQQSFNSLSPFKKPQKPVSDDQGREFCFTDLWHRFTVHEAVHSQSRDEIELTLMKEHSSDVFHCTLQGFWADTKVSTGDVVNILGEFQGTKCVINDTSGLCVVNPDLLLSGTLVVSSVFCARKSVLNEKFRGVDRSNLHMMYGSIIHSLFQMVVKENAREHQVVTEKARSLLKSCKFLHEMYEHNVEEGIVMEEVATYIPSLLAWMDKHMEKPGNRSSKLVPRSDVIVTELHDIEENIWSPRFGIKGKIDLTVKAKLRKSSGLEEKILPLELKTGKASFSAEHQGQVTLYSMMYSDRREDPGEGILLYLKHGEMKNVDVKPRSKSALIQLRNQLSHYLSRQVFPQTQEDGSVTHTLGQLPQPINNHRACSKCAHLLNCSIYQRAVEQTHLPASHPMASLVPEVLSHLQEEDLRYFMHWTLCLDLEDQSCRRAELSQIWRTGSKKRESSGDCLSNLVICSSELGVPESQLFTEGKGCSLTFSRHPECPGPALDTVGLACRDMVVVSSEDGRYIALATGFIRSISQRVVEVVVDRDYLHDNNTFSSIKFRLDRNSFSAANYLYTNLSRLMDATPQSERLRDLIIRNRPPEFELKLPKAHILKVKSIFKSLNKHQKTALLKVLMAKDFVLIKGYPGTGKTSTIVALVKILQALGQSVLLTSYTHSAVDNILLKLQKDGVTFLRLGRQGRIHPSIVTSSAEVLTLSPDLRSVHKLKEFYNSYDIVATSCLGTNHSIFSHRKFDVCIVDEASQVLQPACLGPLFHCHKFVLVGDAKQLPPLVQSKEARDLGMDESLFAKLESSKASFGLCLQYRMNRVIMELSNRLVYNGQLECGSPEIAEECLLIDKLTELEKKPDWIRHALATDIEKSVVFLDTQMILSLETPDGNGYKNEKEAEIVLSLLETLVEVGVNADSIGIISPYKSQVRLLQQKVQKCPGAESAEVNTVDQFQGRDKSVIIVTFVRSGADDKSALLKDVRRLNVAVTRARHKLILLGNASTMARYQTLSGVLEILGRTHNVSFLSHILPKIIH